MATIVLKLRVKVPKYMTRRELADELARMIPIARVDNSVLGVTIVDPPKKNRKRPLKGKRRMKATTYVAVNGEVCKFNEYVQPLKKKQNCADCRGKERKPAIVLLAPAPGYPVNRPVCAECLDRY